MTQTIDWSAIAPPLLTACTAVVVLLVDAFGGPATSRARAMIPATLTVVGLLAASVFAVLSVGAERATFCVGGGACSFVVDPVTLTFWAVVLFGTVIVALLGTAAVAEGRTPQGEWNFLLLCSATGALVIAASRDLVTLVVALEVVSLPAFALVGLRHGDARSAEASVKFFLVSVISTAVTLMGVSLVYGATGSVFLAPVGDAVAGGVEARQVAVAGALLTVVGLAFKVAAVPFHMWIPDTYVGAPVAVAAYLSVVSKAAGFVGLLLVLAYGLAPLVDVWAPIVAVMAALTMTVGNVIALWQQHAVRLLAWSSVAQAGYILVPFGAAAPGSVGGALGASLGYLAIYAVINLGAFAVAAVVGAGRPTQRLTDYRGLTRERPMAGWALAFALVALAGLPPGIVGLLAKVVVFDAVAGPVTWLAVVMAVNVAIGLVYYVRWLVELFRPVEDPVPPATAGPAVRATAGDVVGEERPSYAGALVAVGVTFAAGVVLSAFPGLLLDPVLAALGG